MNEYDLWWTSLKVTRKERIAWKITGKEIPYPECTDVWIGLPEEKKRKIYEHCISSHGLLLEQWKDGVPYGD